MVSVSAALTRTSPAAKNVTSPSSARYASTSHALAQDLAIASRDIVERSDVMCVRMFSPSDTGEIDRCAWTSPSPVGALMLST